MKAKGYLGKCYRNECGSQFLKVIATLNKNSAVMLIVTADGYKLGMETLSINPEEDLKGLTEISTERFDKVHAMIREHILDASHKAGLLT